MVKQEADEEIGESSQQAVPHWESLKDPNGVYLYHKANRNLKPEEEEKIARANVKLRGAKDHFTKTEDRRILKNWRRYARRHNLDIDDLREMLGSVPPSDGSRSTIINRIRNTQFYPALYAESPTPGYPMVQGLYVLSRTVTECLGRKIKYRTARQIYFRARRLTNERETEGNFSPSEDEKLKGLFRLYGNDWSKIGCLMGRTRYSVRERSRILERDQNITLGNWESGETRTLIDAVMKAENLKGSSEKVLETWMANDINWNKVSDIVTSRTPAQCRKHWTAMKKQHYRRTDGRKGSSSITANEKLVDAIERGHYRMESNINWEEISNELKDDFPIFSDPHAVHENWETMKRTHKLGKLELDVVIARLQSIIEFRHKRRKEKKEEKIRALEWGPPDPLFPDSKQSL